MLQRLTDGTIIDVNADDLNSDGTLRVGGRLRVPLMFRDSNRDIARQRSSPTLRFADGRTDAPIGSRPGFITTADSEAVRRAAYEQSRRDLSDAWRTPTVPPVGSDAAPLDPRQPLSMADAQAIRDVAYREMCHELANA
jgi:hypothetical protein